MTKMSTLPVWIRVFYITTIVLILTIGSYFYNNQKSSIISSIERKLESDTIAKVERISDWRNKSILVARVFVESPNFNRTTLRWLKEKRQEDINYLIERISILRNYYNYYDILLLDANKNLVYNFNDEEIEMHSELRELINKNWIHNTENITNIHYTEGKIPPHVDVFIPFTDFKTNEIAGAFVLLLPASEFIYPLLEKQNSESESSETILVSKDGEFVRYMSRLSGIDDTYPSFRVGMDRTDVTAVKAVLGNEGIVYGKNYINKKVISYIKAVPKSDWYLLTTINSEEAFSTWYFRSKMIIFIVILLVAGITVGTGFIWQKYEKVYFRDKYAITETLLKAEERNRVILMSVGNGVIVTDIEGKVEILNEEAEKLTGWSIKEAVGRPLLEVFNIVNEETKTKIENPVSLVLEKGVVVGLANHTLLIDKNGNERAITDSAAPVRLSDGTLAGVVMVFQDQSKERSMLKELQENRNKLKEAHEIGKIGRWDLYHQEDNRLEWTETVYDIFEMSPDEFDSNYECFLNSIHPDDREMVDEAFSDSIKNKTNYRLTHRLLTKSKKLKWILEIGETQYDEKGLPIITSGIVQDISELKNIEEMYSMLFYNMLNGFALHEIICDDAGNPVDYRFLTVNPQFEIMTGLNKEDIIGKTVLEVLPNTEKVWIDKYGNVALTGEPVSFENYSVEFDKYFEVNAFQTNPNQFATIFTDVTERRKEEENRIKLQEELHQAQKMDSIGKLAGGIAHDYNNMLMVILGYVEMSLVNTPSDSQIHKNLTEIFKAAKRSSDITKQLLAFARKQTVSPKTINLNESISDMSGMLKKLIPENINLVWKPADKLWKVNIDPSQIDQIMVNLVVNAQESITGNGFIIIETENVMIDEEFCRSNDEAISGKYMKLTVTDSGCGMSKDVLEKIFLPFFSYKETGKNSGLGLSTVYGIIKQNNGFILVDSELGVGTSFYIFLPAMDQIFKEDRILHKNLTLKGNETILIVDDEDSILDVVKPLMENYGYTVITANNPSRALAIVKEYLNKIDLIITDIVMPELNGHELKKEIDKLCRDAKCLFMSGYTNDVIAHQNVLAEGINFIQKPFLTKDLLLKVREILDS